MIIEDPHKASPKTQDSSHSTGSQVHAVENHERMDESPPEDPMGTEAVVESGPTGDRIDPEKVLTLPSGTILHLYKRGSFCGRAKVVNVNGVPEIYLGHKKDHLWKTRPLYAFERFSFLQGINGTPYVVEVGDGRMYVLTTKTLDGIEVLARKDGYPLTHKKASLALEKAEWCKAQGVNAEILGSKKGYYIKITKVPDRSSKTEVQPQAANSKHLKVLNHGEFINELNSGPVSASKQESDFRDSDNSETVFGLQDSEGIASLRLSPSLILNTAKAAGADLPSHKELRERVNTWQIYFRGEDNLTAYLSPSSLSSKSAESRAMAALALTEMGKHKEARQAFEALKKTQRDLEDYFNNVANSENPPFSINQHDDFIKKLTRGEATAEELKETFQKFIAHLLLLKKELNAKTAKELSQHGVPYYKRKSYIISQIIRDMMAEYVPGGDIEWCPFSETYQEAVQSCVERMNDEHIQEVAVEVKAKKAAHLKAITNPETIEEYQEFIRYNGEDRLNPRMQEHFHSLLKEKADQEAAEKAKIPPKVETKEVGLHGHFVADKKGIKVFANHEEAKADAEKLQGFGFNAYAVGKIIKISDRGEGSPKVQMTAPKTVKVGKDTWLASESGYAMAFEDKDETLVVANKLQQQGYNAVACGLGILIPEAGAGCKVAFTYHENFHTKKGHPIFIAKLTEKVDKLTHNELLSHAKKLGGYYSSYSRSGAIPGFTFKSEKAAKQFIAAATDGA